jgi:hypothetical protein
VHSTASAAVLPHERVDLGGSGGIGRQHPQIVDELLRHRIAGLPRCRPCFGPLAGLYVAQRVLQRLRSHRRGTAQEEQNGEDEAQATLLVHRRPRAKRGLFRLSPVPRVNPQ